MIPNKRILMFPRILALPIHMNVHRSNPQPKGLEIIK